MKMQSCTKIAALATVAFLVAFAPSLDLAAKGKPGGGGGGKPDKGGTSIELSVQCELNGSEMDILVDAQNGSTHMDYADHINVQWRQKGKGKTVYILDEVRLPSDPSLPVLLSTDLCGRSGYDDIGGSLLGTAQARFDVEIDGETVVLIKEGSCKVRNIPSCN